MTKTLEQFRDDCMRKPPDGYRVLSDAEFFERRKQCIQNEDDDGDEAWADLDNVTLYDTSTKQHLPISCAAYFWRIFVEREAAQ